jgi:tRNA-2-methylthio-N6-dimethylallyladenosine synthase
VLSKSRSDRAGQRRAVGQEVEVLLDAPSKTDPTRLTGRTPGNRIVHVRTAPDHAGRLARVRIDDATAHSLRGTPVAVEPAPRAWTTRR